MNVFQPIIDNKSSTYNYFLYMAHEQTDVQTKVTLNVISSAVLKKIAND